MKHINSTVRLGSQPQDISCTNAKVPKSQTLLVPGFLGKGCSPCTKQNHLPPHTHSPGGTASPSSSFQLFQQGSPGNVLRVANSQALPQTSASDSPGGTIPLQGTHCRAGQFEDHRSTAHSAGQARGKPGQQSAQ